MATCVHVKEEERVEVDADWIPDSRDKTTLAKMPPSLQLLTQLSATSRY
jgi:hypothetical protein